MSINFFDIASCLAGVFVGVKITSYAIEKFEERKREKLQKQIKVGETWCLKSMAKNPFEREKHSVIIFGVKDGFVSYKHKNWIISRESDDILTFARVFQKIEIKE